MGAFKKDILKELFEEYEREDCEGLIDSARAISQNDPEVVKAVEFAVDAPRKYLVQNAERFAERGIKFDDKEILNDFESDDLLFIAMIDELEARGYAVEVAYDCNYEEFLAALKTLKTYEMIADTIESTDMGELAEDGDGGVWVEEINAWLEGKAFICYNDIGASKNPLIIVDPETFKLLNGGDDEQPSERNVIGDRELQINLADMAIGLLAEGEDYTELANTRCEFGYLFYFEEHGIEALFKLETDKTIAYFAAQGDKLMRLNFNEELFKSTTEGFLDIHK